MLFIMSEWIDYELNSNRVVKNFNLPIVEIHI